MMKIAYLMPTYPMPSQTFIRREIAALEARGMTVHRFAARRFAGELTDAADRAEQEQTCYLLDAGLWGLARALIADAVNRPGRWLAALAAAIRLGTTLGAGLDLAPDLPGRGVSASPSAGGAVDVSHVHVHFGTNAASVAMLCRQLGGPPYSITIHGPEEFDAPRQLALRERSITPPLLSPSASSRAASSTDGPRRPTGARSM